MERFGQGWKDEEKFRRDGKFPDMCFSESRRCGCIRGFGIGLAGEDEIHEALEKIADGGVGRDGGRRIGLRQNEIGNRSDDSGSRSCASGAGNGDNEM